MGGGPPGPFKRSFWQPPRPHGEVLVGRTVSFLELFYDLVYVAVIAQAAQTLLRGAEREDLHDRG